MLAKNARIYLLMLVLSSFILTACIGTKRVRGSGNSITESHDIKKVDTVKLETIGHVIVSMGDTESLTIEGDDNILEKLTIEVQDGVLMIGQEKLYRLRPKSDLIFHLSLTQLDDVVINGSGDVTLNDLNSDIGVTINGSGDVIANGKVVTQKVSIIGSGDYKATELVSETADLSASGSGSIQVNVTDSVQARIDGSGDIIATGTANTQTISIHGSGDYKALDLVSNNTEASINGSGSIQVNVTSSLTAKIVGSGDIIYSGEPVDIAKRIVGSGELKVAY